MALGFGFNKAKVLASAEKFVQQGKLTNAITEYEKIIKEDPKDLTVLNTVGDLYARVGQNEQATKYFKMVGDQYAQTGFTVKAIAIYKKLSKLTPNNTETTTKLAELYGQQGLYNDARAQYMQIADALLRAGDNNQAARIFQRILEMDPENTATQSKLADLYMKLGRRDEARNIYYNAAESLYVRGSYDAAEEALKKVITLDPNNGGALLLRGLIAADSGDSATAIQMLEKVPDLDKRPDAMRALLRAKMLSGNVNGAEDLVQKLLSSHNDLNGISSLAEWYINNNQVGPALQLYEKNADRLFTAGSSTIQQTLYPLINRIKDNPEGINSMIRLMERAGDTTHTAELLEMQAHALAVKGEYARARDLYQKLATLEPENALHGQNYKQMVAKLGDDSATRILTPEEAAQAFMVEELDQGATVVNQKYDPTTSNAIESALTDAELFVSYNVPLKAIPPLEAALPLAPQDVALNQRLASLYARAERFSDAARICQNLSEIYRSLGHEKEAARYQEAARKYAVRGGGAPQPASPAPRRVEVAPPVAPSVTSSAAFTVTPATDPLLEVSHSGEASIQEFSFDTPDQILVNNEHHFAAVPEPQIIREPMERADYNFQVKPADQHSAHASEEISDEVDVSNEWEDMLSVEHEDGSAVAGSASSSVPLEIETFDRQSDARQPDARHARQADAREPEPARVLPPEHHDAHDMQAQVEEKIQEAQFYISQQMWEPAKRSVNELAELSPDAPEINELMAAVSAGQSRPAATSRTSEAFAASAFEPPPLDYLPPPFSAPVPQVSRPEPEPVKEFEFQSEGEFEVEVESSANKQEAITHASSAMPAAGAPAFSSFAEPAPGIDPLLDVEEVSEEKAAPSPAAPVRPAAPPPQPALAASANSTEDILSDFLLDLEQNDLADFAPQPKAEPAPAASMAATGVPASSTKSAPAAASNIHRLHTNGAGASDTSSALSDILADLQEENTDAAEEQEDPETHYNLGIAFKEMGLLDEAIGELQKVCRAIDKGHAFSQPIQVYTWLAQCLVDKNAPEAAVRWYMKALQLPGLDDGNRCAIYYDLAVAFEASGDKKSALANYMEVYGSNIDFRDVATRIKALKS
jgi:tetratricopeptide (TPR) repeat protein